MVKHIYLDGFSTGANLVLDYAYNHPTVAGLLLCSPAFRSNSSFDWLTPWISWMKPWLLNPSGGRPLQNTVRYLTVPTNGFAQFCRSSQLAREHLHQRPYPKPVFMAVARYDSVLDTDSLWNTFRTRFTHPASRLLWYGPYQRRPPLNSAFSAAPTDSLSSASVNFPIWACCLLRTTPFMGFGAGCAFAPAVRVNR